MGYESKHTLLMRLQTALQEDDFTKDVRAAYFTRMHEAVELPEKLDSIRDDEMITNFYIEANAIAEINPNYRRLRYYLYGRTLHIRRYTGVPTRERYPAKVD